MIPDPTEEIREIKRKLSDQFGNDIHSIAEDARRRQRESGRQSMTVPCANTPPLMTTNRAILPSDGGSVFGSGEPAPAAR